MSPPLYRSVVDFLTTAYLPSRFISKAWQFHMLSEWAIDKSLLCRIFLSEKKIHWVERYSEFCPDSEAASSPIGAPLVSRRLLRSPRYLASQTLRYPPPSNYYYYFFFGKKGWRWPLIFYRITRTTTAPVRFSPSVVLHDQKHRRQMVFFPFCFLIN